MVGGATCDRAMALPLAEQLAQHFTVINYDRRGRGDSGDTAPYAVEHEIEDLGALIAEAGDGVGVRPFLRRGRRVDDRHSRADRGRHAERATRCLGGPVTRRSPELWRPVGSAKSTSTRANSSLPNGSKTDPAARCIASTNEISAAFVTTRSHHARWR